MLKPTPARKPDPESAEIPEGLARKLIPAQDRDGAKAEAIGRCLDLVQAEARESELPLLAHLIGVAALHAAELARAKTRPSA